MNEFAAPPVANLSVSITPDVISDAAIWLDDRDTQLLTLKEDVLIVLLILAELLIHLPLTMLTGYLYHLTRLLHQISHQVLLLSLIHI